MTPRAWVCPVCGAIVADALLAPDSPRPPLHDHDGPTELEELEEEEILHKFGRG